MIAAMLGGLIVVLRFMQIRYKLEPEVSRKLLHVIMGLVSLSLPWLFRANWPVVSLAIASALGLFVLKRSKLKQGIGQVLHSIGRSSQGDLAFPLAIATVFILAQGQPVLYSIPMLILTLADATAALIGLRYGLSRYQAAEGQKSIEGSLAFFVVTFNSVLLTLLLFTEVGRKECLTIAFMLALLVMMLEAISWQGLDNLFIPLAGFLLLNTYLTMSLGQLLGNLSVLLALLLLIMLGRQATGLDGTAIMASALIGYLIWSTSGWLWMIAPLSLFLSYSFVLPKRYEIRADTADPTRPYRLKAFPIDSYTVYTVLSATLPGLVYLLFANSLELAQLILPYMLTFANYLAIIGLGRMPTEGKRSEKAYIFWQSVVYAWVLIPLAFYIWQFQGLETGFILAISLLSISFTAWIFYYVQPHIQPRPFDMQRWRWQAAIAGLSSSLGLIPLLF